MTLPRCRVCGGELADPVGVLERGLDRVDRGEGGLRASAEIALMQILGICWDSCRDQVVSAIAVLLGAQRLAGRFG